MATWNDLESLTWRDVGFLSWEQFQSLSRDQVFEYVQILSDRYGSSDRPIIWKPEVYVTVVTYDSRFSTLKTIGAVVLFVAALFSVVIPQDVLPIPRETLFAILSAIRDSLGSL